MDEFDAVRRRDRGKEAKKRVMQRVYSPKPAEQEQDEFAAVRNRKPAPVVSTSTLAGGMSAEDGNMLAGSAMARADAEKQQAQRKKELEVKTKKESENLKAKDFITAGKEKRDAQDPSNWFLKAIKDNTVDLLGEGIDRLQVNTKVGRAVSRFGQSAGNIQGVDTQRAGGAPILSTGSKFVDKTADIAGMAGGIFVDPNLPLQGVMSLRGVGTQLKGLASKAGVPSVKGIAADSMRQSVGNMKAIDSVGKDILPAGVRRAAPKQPVTVKPGTAVDDEFAIVRNRNKPKDPVLNEMAQYKMGDEVTDFGKVAKPKDYLNETAATSETAMPQPVRVSDGGDTVKPNALDGIDATKLKDFSGFKYNTSDVYRNFKDVFGDKFDQVKKAILDPFDSAKLDNVKMQEEWLNHLHTNVVKKLGIKKGSKLSALVQRYGEKQIDLQELKKLAPKDWNKVVEADQFFRSSYDELIDTVNASRAKIYPNNPEKIVPKREDYYRHFQEFGGMTGLKNIFDTPAGIDPHLVGMSEFTQPKSKFAGFMQKRGMGPFKNDAVGGFLEYIPGASYATHIDPQIESFKGLAKNLADQTADTKNVNGFIEFLQKYSQDLAGKTNSLDRAFQEYIPGGRKTMSVINWVNSRVKANVILGNVSSALAQVANVPAGVAFAKQYAVKGAGKTLMSALKGNPLHEKSQFLKERFVSNHYRKFDTRWLDVQNPLKLKSAATWMLETSDRLGSEFIWNSAYEKAVKQGIANPIKYADDNARRLIAGRGIGEVPLMQKSKLFQTVAPFTLEVANLWRVQKDFIKDKDFAGLVTLMLGSYVFNKAAEQVKGSGVMFDPIQAIAEASRDGLTPMERGGRVVGEVVSNIPLGSTMASAEFLFPEYGGKNMFGMDMPTRKKFFGDNDPTRFGSGLLVGKGLQDPLFKLLPGFGGNQLKKSIEGVQSISKGGAYQDDKLKFQIEKSPLKSLQALSFGSNATKEAQQYYDKERRPLTEKETQFVNIAKDPKAAYEALQHQKRMETLKRSISKVKNDTSKSLEQRQKEVKALMEKVNKLLQEKPPLR